MSENTALHWIVIDEDGAYQLRTLSDSEESARRKAESDIFGLDADWEELAADGYRLVQVAILPAELVDAPTRC